MQKLPLALLAALLLGVIAARQARAQEPARTASGTKTMTHTEKSNPIFCTLGAMTPAQRRHHDETMQVLRRAATHVEELPDGYAFRYDSDPAVFMAAAEFITLESRCCPFFRFRLDQEPQGGSVWLRVTGPKEAKIFIKQALAV